MIDRASANVIAALALAVAGCGEGAMAPTDVALTPPASLEEGFQIATPRFDVPAGTEVQDCYFVDVPYDTPIYLHRFVMTQNPGTHHMNVFRVKTIKDLGGKPGDVVHGTTANPGPCFDSANWSDWPLVTNNEGMSGGDSLTDFTLPDGVAERFEPHELLMLQTHYVNARAQLTPGQGHVLVNFLRMPAEDVKAELGTLFATNQHIRICPGDTDRMFEASCRFARDSPVTIVAANGHFHSRGIRFTMNVFDSISGKGDQFYESRSWDNPPFDRALEVPVPQNGGIYYTCEYTVDPSLCGDPNDSCCYSFGPHSPTQEHCNAFVYYYPKNSTDVNCF